MRWLHSIAEIPARGFPLPPARDFPFYIGKEPKVGKRYRKYFERRPNGAAQSGISAPQFPTKAAWPGCGSCQGSPTASRRTGRGLDTSLSPGPLLRHVGNVQVWQGSLSVLGCGLRYHARCQSPRLFPVPVPVRESNAVLRSPYQSAE